MNLKFLEITDDSTQEEGPCSKNEENLHDRFLRIAWYFDVNHPEVCVIDAQAELSIADARKLYGLGK